MCSVVGYIGSQSSKQPVLHGLLQLEYRGYDSAGYATVLPGAESIAVTKVVGSVAALQEALQDHVVCGSTGIGHTRWSTHGVPSVANAHPHTDCSGTIALVHNGIIENSGALKKILIERGHTIASDTDSELIVHLLEDAFTQQSDPVIALQSVAQQLHGAYACLVVSARHPDTILFLRSRSPLCVTLTSDGGYIASDPVAFADTGSAVCYIPDATIGIVTSDAVQVFTHDGVSIMPPWHARTKVAALSSVESASPHRMLSEIFEQKMVVDKTMRALVQDGISEKLVLLLHNTTNFTVLGCGTSYHAGLMGKQFIESIAGMSTQVVLASEYLYAPLLVRDGELCMAISQSGETADTLEAIRRIKEHNVPTMALTNTHNSTLAREADSVLYTQAGVERAVASTKAFTTQVTVLYWLAHEIALQKKRISAIQCEQAGIDLIQAAALLEETIIYNKHLIDTVLAPLYAHATRAIFLGRQIGYGIACEAALKLKEISYIFTSAYPAGELKHGPLALIESSVPVFLISSQDPVLYRKLVSNAHEIKARGGHLCVFASSDQAELIALADQVIIVPATSEFLMPIAVIGVVQYLCYAIARELGRPIDKPRNLAKSVTVE